MLEPREAGVWLKVARSVHGRAGLRSWVPTLLCLWILLYHTGQSNLFSNGGICVETASICVWDNWHRISWVDEGGKKIPTGNTFKMKSCENVRLSEKRCLTCFLEWLVLGTLSKHMLTQLTQGRHQTPAERDLREKGNFLGKVHQYHLHFFHFTLFIKVICAHRDSFSRSLNLIMRKHPEVSHSKSQLEPCLQNRQHHYRTEKSLAGQGFFYPWRVQRDKTPKRKLWNLIKPWMERKGIQTTFGGLLRKCDCGSSVGPSGRSQGVTVDFLRFGDDTLCGEECPCSQETPAGVFMNEALWCFQLTWSGAEKKWGREKANVEPRLRVYGYDLLRYSLSFI